MLDSQTIGASAPKPALKLDLLVYCRKSSSCKQCYNHALFKVSNLQWVSVVLLALISSSSWRKRRGLSTWKYHKVYRRKVELFPPCANAIR